VPVNATGSTVTWTVALVALVIVTASIATPSPKLAVVVPCANVVNWPSTVTLSCSPCRPVFGVTDVSVGVAASTVNPFCRCAISPCVVREIVRRPTIAPAPIEMLAVAVVGLETVSVLTTTSPSAPVRRRWD
jgi:hypothetical protein